jgi:hypothetical protein
MVAVVVECAGWVGCVRRKVERGLTGADGFDSSVNATRGGG